ncbi:maleate cis-trans isomerase family protein [Rhizobium jaguaris]|uniref:Maleate cis-trans isomerase n=1 Tax=Rhizobium jaguaris TaxID=1312183 RepID=A0A387G7I2_9HYPH|nr:hypothetical protein [Rhizobium jaguaris]AYG64124.1 hypothetical protein CCGE525_35675 [Rhizobium jaguaris]
MSAGASKSVKKIGAIVPVSTRNPIPFEIIDDALISNWLVEQHLANVEYNSVQTPEPDTEIYDFRYYEGLADESLLRAAALKLGEAGCNSVVWGCTSASFLKGLDYARNQARLLAESAGVPATSTSIAFLAALDILGSTKVDVLLPYSPEIAEKLVIFLSEAGISVGSVWHMKAPARGSFFEIDIESELARVSSTLSSHDPILLPCTAISSLARIEILENVSGRPIITANLVTIWHALVLAGVKPSITGAGSFLRAYARQLAGLPLGRALKRS